jgi:hypothetical protein
MRVFGRRAQTCIAPPRHGGDHRPARVETASAAAPRSAPGRSRVPGVGAVVDRLGRTATAARCRVRGIGEFRPQQTRLRNRERTLFGRSREAGSGVIAAGGSVLTGTGPVRFGVAGTAAAASPSRRVDVDLRDDVGRGVGALAADVARKLPCSADAVRRYRYETRKAKGRKAWMCHGCCHGLAPTASLSPERLVDV